MAGVPTGSGITFPGEGGASDTTAPSFSLETLTAPYRKLILTGRALPYQGLKVVGKMKIESIYYPGNPVATQQVIGSEEGDTTINGIWKDRFVAAGNNPGGISPAQMITDSPGTIAANALSVWDLVDEVDKMRRRAQPLRMTWGQVIRHGLISETEFNWLRQTDVEWKITFVWASQGEDPGPFAIPPPSIQSAADALGGAVDTFSISARKIGLFDSLLSAAGGLFRLLSIFSDALSLISSGIEIVSGVVGGLASIVNSIYSAINDVRDAVQSIVNSVNGVVQAIQRVLGIFQYIADQAQALLDLLGSLVSTDYFNTRSLLFTPDDLTDFGPAGAPQVAGITMGQLLAADTRNLELRRTARDLKRTAVTQAAALATQVQPAEMLAVFVSKSTTDLRRTASLYYGSQNSWSGLAQYNKVTTSQPAPGKLILVPRVLPAPPDFGIPAAR
jgi:hypothetical protein